MSTTIPASLKEADIMRFAHRAQQLEKVVPVVAYWCMFFLWIFLVLCGRRRGVRGICDDEIELS